MASNGKRAAVIEEGPDAAQRFKGAVNRVLTVTKAELMKREAAYQKTRKAKRARAARAR